MANLTVVIESDTLKRARMEALEEGTSVNAVVRDYLADYAGTKAQNVPSKLACTLPQWSRTRADPIAAVERGCSCSLQVSSLFLQGWGLIDLPLRELFHPPTHWHAETCH